MRRPLLVSAVLVLAGLSSASPSAQAPPVRNEPGMATIARVFVLNKDRADAIPVNVQSAGEVIPVTVMGMPAVTFAGNTTVSSRATRQSWEYRQLAVASGADPTDALNTAGADGWEAVGAAAAAPGRTIWILKRPR